MALVDIQAVGCILAVHNARVVLMVVPMHFALDARVVVEGIQTVHNCSTRFAPLEEAWKAEVVPLWAVRRKAVAAGSHSIVR